MITIIPTTKERIKKFNIFGCDVSVGFAKYVQDFGLKRVAPYCLVRKIKTINYLIDHNEKDGIITHRFILWKFKIEIKSVVHYDYSLA